MNLKSVSGVAYRVRDVDATTDFYQSLGFRAGKIDDRTASVHLNWFWVEFFNGAYDDENGVRLPQETPDGLVQEALLYLSVDDLTDTYHELLDRGLDPLPVVFNQQKGRKETSICDPDGYRLVFFQKK